MATFKDAATMAKHGDAIEQWWKGLGKNGELEKCVKTIKSTMLANATEIKALDHLERTLGECKELRFFAVRTLNTMVLGFRVKGDGAIPDKIKEHA